MELAKIRSLSDDELVHQEKTTSEQLFRLRFQVSLGQNDGVKKIRELRKEIAQIKTVAKERELGIRGAAKDAAAVQACGGREEEGSPINDGDQEAVQAPTTGARRNEKVGQVVSTKMEKTIVVEVEMRKAHRSQQVRIAKNRSLPKPSHLAPPDIDARRRTLLDGLKHHGDREGVRRMDDGVPVVGKEYPGGEQKAVFLPHAGEGIGQTSKVFFV